MSINAAIVGPTGYAGLALVELLLAHRQVEITYLASRRENLPDLREEFPRLRGRMDDDIALCKPIDAGEIADAADVVFLALPHRAAMAWVPKLLNEGVKVIDLSADYRLDDASLYEQVYKHVHEDKDNIPRAVYGLPELFREDIPGADLVANPGCYPTAGALGIAPLLAHSLIKTDRILINAASGATGAGRKASARLHFPEHNESFYAYGDIGNHRHQPELDQTLSRVAGKSVQTVFIPHLLPVDTGILETIYLEPATDDVTEQELKEAFEDSFGNEPFVRLLDNPPNIKDVVKTNFCDICVKLIGPADNPTIAVFSAEDNIIKGASGQAVQNMNILFGFDETAGLL